MVQWNFLVIGEYKLDYRVLSEGLYACATFDLRLATLTAGITKRRPLRQSTTYPHWLFCILLVLAS